MWVIGVGYGEGHKDPLGSNTRSEIAQLGMTGVSGVKTFQTYVIDGQLDEKNACRIGGELLSDKVVQFFSCEKFDKDGGHVKGMVRARGAWAVEVFFRPGVMDPVGLSVAKAIEVLGIEGVKSVRTGTTYVLEGNLNEADVKAICEKTLANPLIQTYRYERL